MGAHFSSCFPSTLPSSKQYEQTDQQISELTRQLHQEMQLRTELEQKIAMSVEIGRRRSLGDEQLTHGGAASESVSKNNSGEISKCHLGIVEGKRRQDDEILRQVFLKHMDTSGVVSSTRLLLALREVDAPIIPDSENELSGIINQYDSNGDGNLTFQEFLQVVRAPDELQCWLRERNPYLLADALRPLVGRGHSQLQNLSGLQPESIQNASVAICSTMSIDLRELQNELSQTLAVKIKLDRQTDATSSKFSQCFKMACGSISDFHIGLTGRIGMPHLNFKHAMRQEHCERSGCNLSFTTMNYQVTTSPKKEWSYVVEDDSGNVASCPDMGHQRRLVPIKELLKSELCIRAHLTEVEVIAIVLYTGPMFQVYNSILRRYPIEFFENFMGNMFSTTIFVLVSAIQKLCRFSSIPEGTLLYRGLGGKVDLPDIFFKTDEQGCSGYSEWGFLSTTSDQNVAMCYSGVLDHHNKAMIMVIETSSIDRGACISDFSQYPGEKEFLYLPCSFIQRNRNALPRVKLFDGGLVTMVPVYINLNIKTHTIEELQNQRKSMHLVSANSMLEEIKFELSSWNEQATLAGQEVSTYVETILTVCLEVVRSQENQDASSYANDETFRKMVNELFDTKRKALEDMKWQKEKMNRMIQGISTATCTATLDGHLGPVLSCNFHPSLPVLASGSNDMTAKIWLMSADAKSASCVLTLEGHTGQVRHVIFHSQAPFLATCSSDGTAKVWRMNEDCSEVVCTSTLNGHSASVRCVAFHPTLLILATASRDGTAKLWHLNADGTETTCIVTLGDHNGHVFSVTFHPSAPYIATSSRDKTAKVWKLSDDCTVATCVATMEGHRGDINAVAFYPLELIIATGCDDKTTKLWRFNDDGCEACIATVEGQRCITHVAFHPSLPILITCSDDMTSKLWQLSDDDSTPPSCSSIMQGHQNSVTSAAFHTSVPIIATGSSDNKIKLWR